VHERSRPYSDAVPGCYLTNDPLFAGSCPRPCGSRIIIDGRFRITRMARRQLRHCPPARCALRCGTLHSCHQQTLRCGRSLLSAPPRADPYSYLGSKRQLLAACLPAPVTRLPGSAPGTCFAGPHFPWSPPLAPPPSLRLAPLRIGRIALARAKYQRFFKFFNLGRRSDGHRNHAAFDNGHSGKRPGAS
jgi:hypothetical protein